MALGFQKFVFIDNGSDDGSISLLKKHNVTILECKLPYITYKWAFKQFLVKKFGRNIWSLYVDIDELWDYPYSKQFFQFHQKSFAEICDRVMIWVLICRKKTKRY